MDLDREIQLKAELLTCGVRATDEALDGLGTQFKEQNHGLFGWDFEDHVDQLLPDDFELPGGTIVQFRKSSRSEYTMRKSDGRLQIEHQGEPVSEANLLPRPEFYSIETSDGTPMRKICQIGGADSLFLCYNNYCVHWKDGEECLFCNLVPTSQNYQSVLSRKRLEQIGEVAKSAFNEGAANHVLMTGGCYPGNNETKIVTDIVRAIANALGRDTVPGCVLASPPEDLSEISRIYDSGITAVGYSMEIWDERLFAAICPGKARKPGRERFITALDEAVRVFGPGNAICVFVSGLEPMETLLDGVRYMAERGIASLPFIWSPVPGSKLAGHRAPSAEWYVELHGKIGDIYERCGVPDTDAHCYRCDGNSMAHDEVRRRQAASCWS